MGKNKLFIMGIALSLFLYSCDNKTTSQQHGGEGMSACSEEKWEGFTKIKATDIKDNVVRLIGEEWMLITAGTPSSFNTMTASWGAMGELWSKPVSFIAVRDNRYTYEFIEREDYYTLAFFEEEYRETLNFLGSRSGRDTDKITESGLTPLATSMGSMAFKEARMIIECKKLYGKPFDKNEILDSEIIEKLYIQDTAMHTLYVGEIVGVWVK